MRGTTDGLILKEIRGVLFPLLVCLLLFGVAQPSLACVEGLAWGMTLDQVKAHLGETQSIGDSQRQRYIAHHVKLDQIPVSQVMFDLDQDAGLRSLAYEFNVDDMTEVLASLRARHGQPVSTSIEDKRHTEQLWVWNTGDDLITAVKSDSANRQQFLISYRPSRLRPEML